MTVGSGRYRPEYPGLKEACNEIRETINNPVVNACLAERVIIEHAQQGGAATIDLETVGELIAGGAPPPPESHSCCKDYLTYVRALVGFLDPGQPDLQSASDVYRVFESSPHVPLLKAERVDA